MRELHPEITFPPRAVSRRAITRMMVKTKRIGRIVWMLKRDWCSNSDLEGFFTDYLLPRERNKSR